MCEIIFSEGFWACIGAIIGASVGGIATFIVSKKTVTLEIQKEKIRSLDFKIQNLSALKSSLKLYTTELDFEISELNNLTQDLFRREHMFNRARLDDLFKRYECVDCLSDERRTDDPNSSEIRIESFAIYQDAIRIIKEELDQTYKERKSLLEKHS